MTDAIPDEIMREATLVAVDMEIHAALSTTTRAKAEVIAKALMARKRDAQMTDALLAAEARVRELEQRLERAREALEPFAQKAGTKCIVLHGVLQAMFLARSFRPYLCNAVGRS